MIFYLIFGSLALLNGVWWWAADQRLRRLSHPRPWRVALGAFVGAQIVYLALFILAPGLARRSHYVLPMPVNAVFYLWELIVLPVSCVVLLASTVLRMMRHLPAIFAANDRGTPAAPSSESRSNPSALGNANAGLTRRQVLGAAAAVVPPLVTGAAAGWSVFTLDRFRIRPLHLGIVGLPPDLDGLTIAHITDVHVGKFTRAGFLPRVAAAANALRADLHLLTGDLIDLSISDLPVALDFVNRLDPRGRLVMCEGNHDLIDSPSEFYRQSASRGVPLLLDQQTTLRLPNRSTPVQILGTRWGAPGTHGGSDGQLADAVSRVDAQRTPGAFPILLAHHPHAFDPAAAAGFPLTLSGHTHGGLLMLNERVGPAALMYRYWSGPYRKGDNHLVVSNGVGCWFPLRLNSPAEICHITLHRA